MPIWTHRWTNSVPSRYFFFAQPNRSNLRFPICKYSNLAYHPDCLWWWQILPTYLNSFRSARISKRRFSAVEWHKQWTNLLSSTLWCCGRKQIFVVVFVWTKHNYVNCMEWCGIGMGFAINYLVPFVHAKYRPSGLKAMARQNLLSSRENFGWGTYGSFSPAAELHSSTPTLERTACVHQKRKKI